MSADKPEMGGAGDLYGNFLINTLKPFIDSKYRTRTGVEWTALGGSSLGGLITLHLGLKYPHLFGHLLAVSPSVWWDDNQILQTVDNLAEPTDQRIWLYMGTGESDRAVKNVRILHNKLLVKGWGEDNIGYVEAVDAGP